MSFLNSFVVIVVVAVVVVVVAFVNDVLLVGILFFFSFFWLVLSLKSPRRRCRCDVSFLFAFFIVFIVYL